MEHQRREYAELADDWDPMKEHFRDKDYNTYSGGRAYGSNKARMSAIENTALYIQGLPPALTDNGAKNLIEEVALRRPHTVKIEQTQQLWAIAVFDTCENAQTALEKLNGHRFANCTVPLSVKFKTPRRAGGSYENYGQNAQHGEQSGRPSQYRRQNYNQDSGYRMRSRSVGRELLNDESGERDAPRRSVESGERDAPRRSVESVRDNNNLRITVGPPLPALHIPSTACLYCGGDAQTVCAAWKVCHGWYCNKRCQQAHWTIHQQTCPGQASGGSGTLAYDEDGRNSRMQSTPQSSPRDQMGRSPRGRGGSFNKKGGAPNMRNMEEDQESPALNKSVSQVRRSYQNDDGEGGRDSYQRRDGEGTFRGRGRGGNQGNRQTYRPRDAENHDNRGGNEGNMEEDQESPALNKSVSQVRRSYQNDDGEGGRDSYQRRDGEGTFRGRGRGGSQGNRQTYRPRDAENHDDNRGGYEGVGNGVDSHKMRGGETYQRGRGQRGGRGHFQRGGNQRQDGSDRRDGNYEMEDLQGIQDGRDQHKNFRGKPVNNRDGPNIRGNGRPIKSEGFDQEDCATAEGCERQGPKQNGARGRQACGTGGSRIQGGSGSGEDGNKEPGMLEDKPSKSDMRGQTESSTSGSEPRNNSPRPTTFDEPATLSPKEGVESSCTLAHFDSPSDIWVQLSSNAGILKAMTAELERKCKHTSPLDTSELRKGRVVAARYEGGWYRAKIISTDPSLVVQYVDFGNNDAADLEDVVNIPQHCGKVPPLVTHCQLAGAKPKFEEKEWPLEASALLDDVAKQGDLMVECVAMKKGKAIINLFNCKGECVSDLLISKGFAQPTFDVEVSDDLTGVLPKSEQKPATKPSQQPATKPLQQPVPSPKQMPAASLKPSPPVPKKISYPAQGSYLSEVKPDDIFNILLSEKPASATFLAMIYPPEEGIFSAICAIEDLPLDLSKQPPQPGEVVFAKSPEYGWSRALVKSSGKLLNVIYVDCFSEEEVEEVADMSKEYQDIPGLGVQCLVKGEFSQLMSGVVGVKVTAIGGPMGKVKCVLTQDGYEVNAVLTPWTALVESTESPTKVSPASPCVQGASQTSDTMVKSGDKVRVTCFEGANTVYLVKESAWDKLEDLNDDINSTILGARGAAAVTEAPEVEEIVACQVGGEGYYRAVVKSVLHGGKEIEVRLIDTGRRMTTSLFKLANLPQQFMDTPPFAELARLHNVPPTLNKEKLNIFALKYKDKVLPCEVNALVPLSVTLYDAAGKNLNELISAEALPLWKCLIQKKTDGNPIPENCLTKPKLSDCPSLQLTVGATVAMTFAVVENPAQLVALPMNPEDVKMAQELVLDLEAYRDAFFDKTAHYSPEVEEVCLYVAKDECLYRGVCLAHEKYKATYIILSIDFGGTEEVAVKNIRRMNPDLMIVPCGAMCILDGFQDVVDPNYSPSSDLIKFLSEALPTPAHPLELTVKGILHGVYIIELPGLQGELKKLGLLPPRKTSGNGAKAQVDGKAGGDAGAIVGEADFFVQWSALSPEAREKLVRSVGGAV